MARLIILACALVVLMLSGASSLAAQEATCATLSADEAQAALNADPTYATRSVLDADEDGIACNEDLCAEMSADEAQAALDADPTYATRAQLDPDEDGVACNEPGSGGTVTGMPDIGVGTMAGASSRMLALMLLGLSCVFALASLSLRPRARESVRA